MSDLLISAENLSLGYEGQSVCDGVTFSVSSGDYLCILGDNGAGKSTLVKAMLNLHKPLSGTLKVDTLNGRVGYLPQRSDTERSFPSSVTEVVLSGFAGSLGKRFFYSKDEKALAVKNMERLGISSLKDCSYQELSGGQRQRVLLARALSAAKDLLLLDEPVSGLDVASSAELYSLIEKLNKEGMTVIMVTHDIHPALNSANKILHLGSFFYFGPSEGFFSSEGGKEYLEKAGHHYGNA